VPYFKVTESGFTGRNTFPFFNLADFLVPLFAVLAAMFFLLTSDRPCPEQYL
jgi:hypothetical protein